MESNNGIEGITGEISLGMYFCVVLTFRIICDYFKYAKIKINKDE